MKRQVLQLGLPVVLGAFLAGCSTQPTNDSAAADNAKPSAAAPQRAAVPPASRSTSAGPAAGRSDAKTAPAARSVYYDFDSSEIRSEGRTVIQSNAQYLREHPAVKVRIEGNADERGSAEYNLALGQRRAESVMRAMRLTGMPEDRMEAVSYGKEKPRAAGHDEASWAENRRSDIRYR